MSDIIISVEHLSKRYKLGQIGATTLRDSAERLWHRFRGRDPSEHMGQIGRGRGDVSRRDHRAEATSASRTNNATSALSASSSEYPSGREMSSPNSVHLRSHVRRSLGEGGSAATSLSSDFWALRDVSFEVKRGEVLGIIGRNGAGKSTLLKILSRITEPTSGRAVLRGRVGSLLEVGTGFHPELSGRENIYLNGAILGMKKREIDAKFDEIVAFAEIERFLDTPVKRYSSGMYVRLAFAVAAHLDPEILIVDEVLAVGDASFQKKCIAKMGDVAREGRTVLIVSHNMPMVVNLASRAIVLCAGRAILDASPVQAVESYLTSASSGGGEVLWPDIAAAPGNEVVRLCSVRILQDGIAGSTADVDIAKEVRIEITYRCLRSGEMLYTALWLKDNIGTPILSSSNSPSISLTPVPWYTRPTEEGVFRSYCRIPANFLNELVYCVTPILGRQPSETILLVEDVISFKVHDTGEMRKEFYGGWLGVIRPKLAWETERISYSNGTE